MVFTNNVAGYGSLGDGAEAHILQLGVWRSPPRKGVEFCL